MKTFYGSDGELSITKYKNRLHIDVEEVGLDQWDSKTIHMSIPDAQAVLLRDELNKLYPTKERDDRLKGFKVEVLHRNT